MIAPKDDEFGASRLILDFLVASHKLDGELTTKCVVSGSKGYTDKSGELQRTAMTVQCPG
jgi:hypothetical protein